MWVLSNTMASIPVSSLKNSYDLGKKGSDGRGPVLPENEALVATRSAGKNRKMFHLTKHPA